MSQNPSKTFRKIRIHRKSVAEPSPDLRSKAIIEITRYGIGLDVHKDTVMVCVCAQTCQSEILDIRSHQFRNSPPGLQEMTAFLSKFLPVSHYLMECTGIYHRPVYHALERAFPNAKDKILAMNPLLVHRRLTDLGNKHDKADARRMAELSFYERLLRPSYVGSPAFFHLRDTLRNYQHTKKETTRYVNRIHRLLCSINFMYKLDLHQEWCLHFLDYAIHNLNSLGNTFQSMIEDYQQDGKPTKVLLKHQTEILVYGDITIPQGCRFNLRQLLLQYFQAEANATQYLLETERQILKDLEFQQNYIRLLEIPCVGQVSALHILTELGDFHRFKGWKAFAKFCGVVPTIQESGGTRAAGHINRFTNAHLRRVLTQVAILYVNGKAKGTDLGIFAHRQRNLRGLPFKKAVMRVAQKLSRIIYGVLVNNVEYNPMYEQAVRKMQRLKKRQARSGTMLEPRQTKSLKRDISGFLVSNHDILTSKSRFFLVKGFQDLIRKSRSLGDQEDGPD